MNPTASWQVLQSRHIHYCGYRSRAFDERKIFDVGKTKALTPSEHHRTSKISECFQLQTADFGLS